MLRLHLLKERDENVSNTFRIVILTSERETIVEDAELETLVIKDRCQSQEELALRWGMTRKAILKRLNNVGMTQMQRNRN